MHSVHQTSVWLYNNMVQDSVQRNLLKCSLRKLSGTSRIRGEIILRATCIIIILYQERKLCTEKNHCENILRVRWEEWSVKIVKGNVQGYSVLYVQVWVYINLWQLLVLYTSQLTRTSAGVMNMMSVFACRSAVYCHSALLDLNTQWAQC